MSENSLPNGLAKPAAIRALTSAGYLHLEQFIQLSEAEVLKLHGMGPKAITTIKNALEEKGLTFKK
ncbi:DNA-binding protein [Gottfriedia sp. NPDC057991]|uniref:DNA-binding protein n=1 Tax=Gottfriedia sp. NPDC057991 TaxID=3346298 RepID=UPI0036DF83F7